MPQLGSEDTENNCKYFLSFLCAPSWEEGEEMQPVIAVTERQRERN